MVQPANAGSVQGDFTRGTVTLRGQDYTLSRAGDAFYITESYLTGHTQQHRIDYTLGNRRIQHYLTTLPDGRILVLPPSWDIARKQWFHNFDIGDPDESGDVEVQLWNKGCFSCHVSQEEKNFDPDQAEYKTSWLDFGVNCERCHGPAAKHVADYSTLPRPTGAPRDIVVQTRLDSARNTEVCGQCHSFRDIFVAGFNAGDNFYDHFIPIMRTIRASRRMRSCARTLQCCVRSAIRRSARRLRRILTMRRRAPEARAWNAICRGQCSVLKRRSAIIR
jgi:hypothetical protein